MMMMMGFGTRGRCKTKFRSCEGRGENGAEADEGRSRAEKEVGEMCNNIFLLLTWSDWEVEWCVGGGEEEFGSLTD